MIDVDRVDDLGWRDVDVCRVALPSARVNLPEAISARPTDDAEVLVEAVTDEHAAEVDEHAQLLVSDFERNEGMPRVLRVEIASCVEWAR